jgi:curved DNA-binding protein CbpA
MRKEPDYYVILGVDPSISADELRKRHKSLVRELHPDRHGGDPEMHERLTLINVAFHELRDENRRSAYDRRCREQAYRIVPLDINQGPDEEYIPRPIRRTFKTGYGTFSERKRPHNRRAIVGVLLATVLSLGLVLGFLFFFGGSFQTNNPEFGYHSTGDAAQLSSAQSVQNTQKQESLDVEERYDQQYKQLLSEGQESLNEATVTATTLDDDGDSGQANSLRRQAENFESALYNAGQDLKPLGEPDNSADEQQLEQSLSKRLDDIETAETALNKTVQSAKSSTVVSGVDSTQSEEVPTAAQQTAFTQDAIPKK